MTVANSPDRQHQERPHLAALDGIRGLAILMVFGHHLFYVDTVSQTGVAVWSRAFVASLWSGVDVFFALSGFLITGILLRTVGEEGFFRNFYARRSLRIFPLYYAILALLFVAGPWLHIHWNGQQWRLLTYSNHLWIEPHATGWNFYFGGLVYLDNFWSLHVEEQFYLVWPLIVFLVRSRTRLLGVALGLSLLSFAVRLWFAWHGMSYQVLYATLMTRADNLLIGASLAIVLQTRFRLIALRLAPAALVLSLLGLFAIFVGRHGLVWDNPLIFSLEFPLLAVASTALIAVCLQPENWIASVFTTRIMRFFGKYSYGLYIYHTVLPIFVIPVMLRLLMPIAHRGLVVRWIIVIAQAGAAIVVSMLSYRYLEMPFLRLKRFFEYRRNTSPATENELEVGPQVQDEVRVL